MQIRYRITLAYTITVTIVLLLLCTSVYFFSAQNRINQFNDRLLRKSVSTQNLLWTYTMKPEIVKNINRTSPSSLMDKSIILLDSGFDQLFYYQDDQTDSLVVPKNILSQLKTHPTVFFSVKERDAIAMRTAHNGKTYYIITAASDSDRAEWLPKLRLILILSYILSLIIVIAMGYFFSLSLVRSLSDLTGKINDISSTQFSKRLFAGAGKDELQKLAVTINNLLDRLQSSFNTQRSFIDNASHELSTPLASIGSQIEVALQRERDNEEYKKVLISVYEDVKRLNILVKSLLEIAKTSGSAKGIELAPVRIDECLMRLPAEVKKMNKSFEVSVSFEALPDDENDLTVYGNEELLFAAFKNIALNACKYSDDKKAIVSLKNEKGEIVVTIEDHGTGIAEGEKELIFRPFYRGADVNSIVSGSGLGLPLANQIIKLYRGHIEVHSTLGRGSIFTIRLKSLPAV
jgi:signal transduction histidine kinase